MENPRNEEGKHLSGLGTPATRGAILQKLSDRKYTELKGKSILITDDGKFLIDNILKNEELKTFISIPETTRWEEELHTDTEKFLAGIKDFTRLAVKNTSMETYKTEKEAFGKCPLCGKPVFEGKKNYYCEGYKEGCKFVIWKEICTASVGEPDVKLLLAGKQTKAKKCKSKAGKEFQAAFYLKDGRVEFKFEERKK